MAREPCRGTLEIFTGGGKTLIALAAFAQVSSTAPETRLAVVAPTEALARQWVTSLQQHTTLSKSDIGMLGAGRHDSFAGEASLGGGPQLRCPQAPGAGADGWPPHAGSG